MASPPSINISNDPTLVAQLGSGLCFPIQLTASGSAVVSTGIDLIRNSIITIITWLIGTKFYLGEFGSLLDLVLQKPNTVASADLAENYIRSSLITWEPRITVMNVSVRGIGTSDLALNITYVIKNTNLQDTFTYPFYKTINT